MPLLTLLSAAGVLGTPINTGNCNFTWSGTAPLCDGMPADCTRDGQEFVRIDDSGDGQKCLTGNKVLCQRCGPNKGFLANWMGNLLPALRHQSLLDISLPGTHDSMTYDLSTTTADNTNDIPPSVAAVMHELAPELGALGIGEIFRDLAQTQGLSMKGQLESGIRFIDLRVTYSAPPDKGSFAKKDWYSLHSVESNNNAMSYLKQAKDFMVAHPNEIVVFWLSRHGSECTKGTDQFPNTTPAQRQAFWAEIKDLFGDMVFDKAAKHGRLNETTLGEMVAQNQRAVFYLSDWEQFSNNDTKAYDACNHLNNTGHGGDLTNITSSLELWKEVFKNSSETQRKHAAKDAMYLVSLAASPPVFQVSDSIVLKLDAGIFKRITSKSCASSFHIPNMTDWCPGLLVEVEQLRSYYLQIAMEAVAAAEDGDLGFPGAIYLDAVDTEGTIRTGTLPLSESVGYAGDPSGSTGYAMVDTMLLHNVRKACKQSGVVSNADCQALEKILQARRAQNPLKRWDDPEHGRLAAWPVK